MSNLVLEPMLFSNAPSDAYTLGPRHEDRSQAVVDVHATTIDDGFARERSDVDGNVAKNEVAGAVGRGVGRREAVVFQDTRAERAIQLRANQVLKHGAGHAVHQPCRPVSRRPGPGCGERRSSGCVWHLA